MNSLNSSISLFLFILLSSISISAQQVSSNINVGGMTVSSRVVPPTGFVRTPLPATSFQSYLQSLDIKEADAKVMKFNGYAKKYECYSAVMDLELMEEDLMHGEHYVQKLRAQYLYNHSKYDMIKFSYDDGRTLSYEDWANGFRYVLQDSIYVLDSTSVPSNSQVSFIKYMNEIYTNTSTNGLVGDTEVLEATELSIGDVLIQPKDLHHKGHAVLVLDMVVSPETGEKLFLLAQGFMPAQNMHILSNPYDTDISPWYKLNEDELFFATAQWTFRKKHIRRFSINANASNLIESIKDPADD